MFISIISSGYLACNRMTWCYTILPYLPFYNLFSLYYILAPKPRTQTYAQTRLIEVYAGANVKQCQSCREPVSQLESNLLQLPDVLCRIRRPSWCACKWTGKCRNYICMWVCVCGSNWWVKCACNFGPNRRNGVDLGSWVEVERHRGQQFGN